MMNDIFISDLDAAARGHIQGGHHAHGCRFAGTVRADEADDLAAMNVEADAAHGMDVVKDSVQIAHLNEGVRKGWGSGLGDHGEKRGRGSQGFMHGPA